MHETLAAWADRPANTAHVPFNSELAFKPYVPLESRYEAMPYRRTAAAAA